MINKSPSKKSCMAQFPWWRRTRQTAGFIVESSFFLQYPLMVSKVHMCSLLKENTKQTKLKHDKVKHKLNWIFLATLTNSGLQKKLAKRRRNGEGYENTKGVVAGCNQSARVAACSRGGAENRDLKFDTFCFPQWCLCGVCILYQRWIECNICQIHRHFRDVFIQYFMDCLIQRLFVK